MKTLFGSAPPDGHRHGDRHPGLHRAGKLKLIRYTPRPMPGRMVQGPGVGSPESTNQDSPDTNIRAADRAYGCGDLCVDINGCPLCKVVQVADITAGPVRGVPDDSAVVFVSCVLEYVNDPAAAVHELRRMAGSPENLFDVAVQHWTLTAALYPGARWTMVREAAQMTLTPVTTQRKVVTAAALAGLVAASIR